MEGGGTHDSWQLSWKRTHGGTHVFNLKTRNTCNLLYCAHGGDDTHTHTHTHTHTLLMSEQRKAVRSVRVPPNGPLLHFLSETLHCIIQHLTHEEVMTPEEATQNNVCKL